VSGTFYGSGKSQLVLFTNAGGPTRNYSLLEGYAYGQRLEIGVNRLFFLHTKRTWLIRLSDFLFYDHFCIQKPTTLVGV